ncbi:hypothetical protein DVA76_19485, partial [Acinetobacter baumannii]
MNMSDSELLGGQTVWKNACVQFKFGPPMKSAPGTSVASDSVQGSTAQLANRVLSTCSETN